MRRPIGFLCLLGSLLTPTWGCKSSGHKTAAPALVAPKIDCGYVLPTALLERACSVKLLRSTRTTGEGWKAYPVCDRKYYVPGGGWVGFRLRYLGDAVRARAYFKSKRDRALKKKSYQPVAKVGEEAYRLVDRVLGKRIPSLLFRVGPWSALLYTAHPRTTKIAWPICSLPRLAGFAPAVAARVARLPKKPLWKIKKPR